MATTMTDFDAIVIGSGAGGLTAALGLARLRKRVIVLEQHYLPGGWCQSFDLGGYRFSPGVHYVGECGPGGRMRRIWEGLGLGADLEMCELNPDGFDHILVGEERFDIPKGKQAFADRLRARFPGEARGIDGYLDATERISRELDQAIRVRSIWDVLKLPFRAPTVTRWGFRSLDTLLDAHVRDPMLRAILCSQVGDHGLPPSQVPAAVHCSVAAHYFDGGWYPRGGGASIPRAYIRGLKRRGGTLRVRASVDRILVEKGIAIGVRLASGEVLRAPIVISNADPQVTYGRLLEPQHVSWRTRRALSRTRWSVSAISLFAAVDMDLRAMGFDSGNYWRYAHTDIDAIYRLGMDPRGLEVEEIPGLFVTVTTLKDPSKMRKGHHTIEAFAFTPYEPFARWAATRYGERPEDYQTMKRDLQAKMLRAVNRVIPGFSDHVVFADLGTPLTNQHYVEASFGNLYGTEKSRFHIGPWAWPLRTEVGGLFLCGASTLSHGVMGAALTGLIAAARATGCRTADMLETGGPALRCYPADHPESWPEALRRRVGSASAVAAHA